MTSSATTNHQRARNGLITPNEMVILRNFGKRVRQIIDALSSTVEKHYSALIKPQSFNLNSLLILLEKKEPNLFEKFRRDFVNALFRNPGFVEWPVNNRNNTLFRVEVQVTEDAGDYDFDVTAPNARLHVDFGIEMRHGFIRVAYFRWRLRIGEDEIESFNDGYLDEENVMYRLSSFMPDTINTVIKYAATDTSYVLSNGVDMPIRPVRQRLFALLNELFVQAGIIPRGTILNLRANYEPSNSNGSIPYSYSYRAPARSRSTVNFSRSVASSILNGSRKRPSGSNFINAAMVMKASELENTANSLASKKRKRQALYVKGEPGFFTLTSLKSIGGQMHPLTRVKYGRSNIRRATTPTPSLSPASKRRKTD